MFKNFLFIFLICFFAKSGITQGNEDKLMLSGVVEDYFSGKSLSSISIKVTENGKSLSI